MIEPHNDAYLLSKCMNVTEYTIFWNRTYNNTCYSLFPVYLHGYQSLKFLSLTKRHLLSRAPAISCKNSPVSTYVADTSATLWLFNQNGTATSVNYSQIFLPSFSNTILRVGELNSHLHLLQFVSEPFDTFSLLDILACSQETIEHLDNIRANDEDNDVVLGIGKIIGSRRSGISSGGSTISKALGSAPHSGLSGAGDLDENVVTSLGKAIGRVIDSSGRAFEHVSRGAGGFFMMSLVV